MAETYRTFYIKTILSAKVRISFCPYRKSSNFEIYRPAICSIWNWSVFLIIKLSVITKTLKLVHWLQKLSFKLKKIVSNLILHIFERHHIFNVMKSNLKNRNQQIKSNSVSYPTKRSLLKLRFQPQLKVVFFREY